MKDDSLLLKYFEKLENEISNVMQHQQMRVQRVAHSLNPRLTTDDLLQPHDFPELQNSAEWNYEDGVLAGLRSAQILIRRLLRETSDL